MKLTKEHINNLYAFTKKHKVEYYDLQSELVDHLANDIENIWKKNPNLTFEQARYKATIKFGILGFSTFVSQREKAMRKKNWRLFKQYFKAYFKLPRLIFTLFLIALVYLFFELTQSKYILLISSLIIISTIASLYTIILSIKFKLKQKRTLKKWLYEDIVTSSSPYFIVMLIFQPYQLYNLLYSNININWSFYIQLLWSIIIALSFIFIYVSLWIIPPKMKETVLDSYKIN